jgi:multidrug efflux system outer membrane protein
MSRRSLITVAILCISGCKLGPDFERPEVEQPVEYRQPTESGESIANLGWWEIFDDEYLQALIETALTNNKDLAIAVSRIEEARARYGFVRADQFPFIDAQAGASRGNTFIPGIPAGGISDNFVVAGGLSFEVDLFGKLRRSTESARASLLATEEARRAVMISLIADVANSYLLLLDVDTRLEISRRTLKTRKDSLDIITARFEKGTVPMIDVNQAEIEQADATVQVAAFERSVVQTENQLNILLGGNPGVIPRGGTSRRLAPPQIPVGLPSELLERRPDVRQAEQLLAAQTAQIGVAEALRFPSLGLTGTLGLASNDLSNLTDGDSKIWSVGANLFSPIFNSGQNKRRVEIERARTEQALRGYELTVLQAFREVEDSLVAIRTLADEAQARQVQVTAAQSASMLSKARYNGGVTSYLEVLESDRSLFRSELAESAIRREQLGAYVDLYKALGGGWN